MLNNKSAGLRAGKLRHAGFIRQNKSIVWIFLATAVFLLAVFFVPKKEAAEPEKSDKASEIREQPLVFFDEKLFYQAVNQAKENKEAAGKKIAGGIIPHHLLASFMIADFFKTVSAQKVENVFLIGPNHYEKGKDSALTSIYNWSTPFGQVATGSSIINRLVENKLAGIDDKILEKEHSVAGIMPFIKYYLPGAKVVPIILSQNTTRREMEKLSDELMSSVKKENSIIIASVDFSHYLTSEEAEDKDRETLKIMENFEYELLLNLDNDHLDSPASIGVMMMAMEKIKSGRLQILQNTNSGNLLGERYGKTTSYFSIIYPE